MKLTLLNSDPRVEAISASLHALPSLVDEEIGELPGQVNLVFCDDAKIRQLNKDYRDKHKVTDVLTFTYYEGETHEDELLGEVFLALDQCERQCEEQDWSEFPAELVRDAFEMEVFKLFIHGLLHLRGYDHVEDEDYRVMKLLEDKIMKSFLESSKNLSTK